MLGVPEITAYIGCSSQVHVLSDQLLGLILQVSLAQPIHFLAGEAVAAFQPALLVGAQTFLPQRRTSHNVEYACMSHSFGQH
jgi:hypothetical protein